MVCLLKLDNTVEGLVRMSSMVDDYYVYNEKQYSLIGERTRKIYRIGNAVKVQLVKSDVDARQIEFVLVEDGKEEAEKEMADTKRPKRKRKKIDEKVLRHVQGKKKKKKKKRPLMLFW